MNDELERLFTMYDRGHLDRRQLLHGLLDLGLGTGLVSPRSNGSASDGLRQPLFRAHPINHVTIRTADVPRSKAVEPGQRAGYDHFCFGVDAFDASRALAVLEAAVPEAQPSLESGDQVFLRDPDGVRVQLADVKYKR